MLEVIGNNLANVNTTAFKSSRVLFSDLMYEGQRGASSGSGAVLGSINPLEIGTGSKVASVDLNFNQGNLEATGESLDAAIDGNGFFVARAGDQTYFTRAGSFSLDENGYLVDPATGYLIQRFGTLGEPDGATPAFQAPGDDRVRIPIGASIPGSETTEISLSGNLSAASTGPQAQVISSVVFTPTLGGVADATTLLNDLSSTTNAYVAGDVIRVSGQDDNGDPVVSSIAVDATTTLGDVSTAIQTLYPGATVAIVDGAIQLTANSTGPSFLSLTLSDGQSNTGISSNDAFGVDFARTVKGANASVIRGSVPVFDERGTENVLSFSLTKQTDETWTLEIELDPALGTILDGTVEGIRFGTDGSFGQITGTLQGDANVEIQFNGSQNPQTIDFSFGTPGGFDGLTEVGAEQSLSPDSDGYAPGELTTVQIDADGTISGIASNGLKFPMAQLALASFRNPDGLLAAGNSYFEGSLASGNPEIGTAISGDRGAVRSGQLEGSNVDLALEFTRLIVAQRGFSANARTITVTDEVLEELTNIIR